MESLLKGNFKPKADVEKEPETPPDPKEEYLEKALESISGSMVFVERRLIYWDGKE